MPESKCNSCSKIFTHGYSSTGKYCSRRCTADARNKEHYSNFLEGKTISRGGVKKFLVELYGWKCMCCENAEWQGQPIPLELDHIDGNAGDNSPTNVRLLCPNCHAQTPTHKGKNKGFGRAARGLKMY